MRTTRTKAAKEKMRAMAACAVLSASVLALTVFFPRVVLADPTPDPSPIAASRAALGHQHTAEDLDLGVAMPVPTRNKLSSGYGMRSGRGTTKRVFHAGIDFQASRGTPVFAARDGVVELVSRDARPHVGLSGYGNAIAIYHPDQDVWTLYAHLDKIQVKPGQKIKAGQRIGKAGNTSNRSFKGMGAHLHFEVRKRTAAGRVPFPAPYKATNLDPERWLSDHGLVFDAEGHLHSREIS